MGRSSFLVIILHPYTKTHPERQSETWEFLKEVRKKYTVVDRICEGEYGYNDFLAEYWGRGEDIVIVEMDMVPTMEDLEEIVDCHHTHCNFPYRPGLYPIIRLKNFDGKFFNEFWGIGFVKISAEAQKQVPVSTWSRASTWLILDRSLAIPLIARLGPYHMHMKLIKHNHPYNWWSSGRQFFRGLFLSVEVLLNHRFVESSFKSATNT